MKYIKKFDTTTLYNNATLDLPNVSLTMDDREVHYNPYDGRLVAKYNITSTSSATKLLGSSSNISAIEIDGTALNNVVTTYTFSTTGIHTVKYTLTDNTSISDGTFSDCYNLTDVTIPNSVTSIGESVFEDCLSLTTIIIPESVISIGERAFQECSSLTSVTIPSSVTSISRAMFSGCSYLTNITIPSSVTSINGFAFYLCSRLTSITIPNSVTNIGDSAFDSCVGLTTLTIQATTPPTLGTDALLDTNSSLVIKVPSASVNAYKSASGWSAYASRIQAI